MKSIFILLSAALFLSSSISFADSDTDREAGYCPGTSTVACRQQQIGEACATAAGTGVCVLTPLTAGGFCRCASKVEFKSTLPPKQIMGGACCSWFDFPSPGCFKGC